MIAVDTNILIHLLVRSQVEHPRAAAWFAKNEEPLALTGVNIAEALRLLTHPRVFPDPLSLDAAVDLINNFLEVSGAAVLEDAVDWWDELKGLTELVPGLRGNEIFDAQIALCLRYHGVKKILTLDADFSKYEFLKIVRI